MDVNAEDEGDLWDAILNDDAPSAPPVVVEQKKATHYGHISPEKSQQMQRPMRDVVAEQKRAEEEARAGEALPEAAGREGSTGPPISGLTSGSTLGHCAGTAIS